MISEKYSISVFKAMPVPCIIIKTDTPCFTIIDVNSAYLKASGFTENKLTGKPFFESIFSGSTNDTKIATEFLLSFNKVISSNRPHKTMTCKPDLFSGTQKAIFFENIPVLDENGSAELVIHCLTPHPVADNKPIPVKRSSQTEYTQASKDPAGSAFQAEPGLPINQDPDFKQLSCLGYWEFDLSTEQISWSREVYHIWEIVPNEPAPTLKKLLDTIHPEDRPGFLLYKEKVLNRDFPPNFQYRIVLENGKVKHLNQLLNLVCDKDNKPMFLKGAVQDVTGIREKAHQLKWSNDRHKLLLKATNEAICDWDIENDRVDWGQGFHDIFGYDLSVYDNYLWSNNIHPEDKEWVLRELEIAMEDPAKELFHSEYRYLKANRETVIIRHRGIFLRNEHGKAIRAVGSFSDITESKQSLFKIQEQNDRLREIAWIQSHLVRAPLARLKGLVDLLMNNTEELNQAEILQFINISTDELDTVIREIIDKAAKIEYPENYHPGGK